MKRPYLDRFLRFVKKAARTSVTIFKDGKSYTFPTLEDCSSFFSKISALDKDKTDKMVRNREHTICGYRIFYEDD